MSIPTLNAFISPAATNASNTQIQQASNTSMQSTETTTSESTNNEEIIKLSSRAQKIQMLNEEFFPGGPSSVTITPDFIQRLYEYGFISESEANNLGNTTIENTASSSPLGELSTDLNNLSKRLNSESNLVDILERADAIINNFDGTKPSSLTNNIKLVNAELNAYLESTDAEQLTEIDKQTMSQLSLALTIADKLNPNNLTSEKLNSYLSFV